MPRLFQEASRVVRQDGIAVFETVNPHSVQAYRFLWLDRTHTIPVFPESALMMARAARFTASMIVSRVSRRIWNKRSRCHVTTHW
jgi:hypothetical protein